MFSPSAGFGRQRIHRFAAVAAAALMLGTAGACSPVESAEQHDTKATHSPSPTPRPVVQVQGKDKKLSYSSPIEINAKHGTITSVTVDSEDDATLVGTTSPDGTSWTSKKRPLPQTSYTAKVTVEDAGNKEYTKTLDLHVKTVPVEQRLTFDITPDARETVGIGQPIVVRFLKPVTHHKAVEKAMDVKAKTPSGDRVTGRWHWFSDQLVHWRPKEFWTPGTTVKLHMDTAGVRASSDLWGRKDYSESFTIGESSVLKVNAQTHMMKVYRSGEHVATWPTGTGMPEYPTRNGTYIVLNKSSKYNMTSCSAGIACDKDDPAYYDTTVHWAVRITTSGTFVHAAPWDNVMGQANTSHGCIHLSTAHAHRYYENARPGDVVIVEGSNQGPQDRVAAVDPGMVDWNMSWSQWKAGSALS